MAAPTLIQSSQNFGSGASGTVARTFDAPTAAGNAILCVVMCNAVQSVSGIADDSAGSANVYNKLFSDIVDGSMRMSFWVSLNTLTATTPTATLSASSNEKGIAIYEIHNFVRATRLIQATGTSVAPASGSTLVQRDEGLAVGAFVGDINAADAVPVVLGSGWAFTGSGGNTSMGNGSTTFAVQGNEIRAVASGQTVNANFTINASRTWQAGMLMIAGDSDLLHNADAYIFIHIQLQFAKLAGRIQFQIPTNGYVKLIGTVLAPQLSFVRLLGTIIGNSPNLVNLAGRIQEFSRAYVKLAGKVSSDKTPTHQADAWISNPNNLSFVQMVGTIVGKNVRGPCMSFPDASFVRLAGWIVIPGDSQQLPNSGFSAADDFLSSQLALAAYKPISIINLAGFNLIITAFTTGVLSWQTRTRSWLNLQDAAPNGILLTTVTNTHTLPNGATVTTTTQTFLIQDITKVVTTIQNSATPERTSVIITEKSQNGNTVVQEQDTVTINGIKNTVTKRNVLTSPPTTDNVQPITVRTLDGVTHYQFFAINNPEWSGGDQEGLTQTAQQVQVVPGTLNGKTVDAFGNPILSRITNTVENDPSGKVITTNLTETGISDAGTTVTNTSDTFNGIQETEIVTTTYPDGSQTVKKSVKNNITGDTVVSSTETVTDEYGQITTTVTLDETKTFPDPVTGILRTTETKTVNVTKSGVTTTDTQVTTTTNFEDSIINQKVKVIFIQELTLTCVIDETSMFALWEINESHQRLYALQELFTQQLGNGNLSYLLRQNLISQFNAANCVPSVPMQVFGKIYNVVFAPSASSFRAKEIPGTEPHVYELQMILQERSDLVNGTIGF